LYLYLFARWTVHTKKILTEREREKLQGGSNMTGTNCDLFTHNQYFYKMYIEVWLFLPSGGSSHTNDTLTSRFEGLDFKHVGN
jgi:hypothetical protein